MIAAALASVAAPNDAQTILIAVAIFVVAAPSELAVLGVMGSVLVALTRRPRSKATATHRA